MAASLNKVFLMGNLTREPELRYTPSGMAVCKLGLAVNRRYRDRSSNEFRDETCFVDITVWEKMAENCGQYLAKGSAVMVEGRLKFSTWESEGQKRNKLEVVANNVQFLSRPGASQNGAPESEKIPGADENNIPF